MNFPHLQCDASIVEPYLSGRLTGEQASALETHLEGCEACRRSLDEAAAGKDWWSDASRFLPADEWDGPSRRTGDHDGPETSDRDESQEDPAAIVRRLSGWLAPTDDPRMLGRFAGYEIVGVIGEGGMGVVLKGHEPSLNRYVAIKVLAPHLASNGAARQRFSREAQAAAAVLHENVIAIHRVDEWQGLPYLVMPYIAGVSLQKRLDRDGPLPVLAVLRIGRQVAAGLAAAHAQGLVHRDVKPANILLERGVDRVTLTDFGLARAVDDATVTRSGMIAGTPQFMSPEQARGDAIDVRSDLFSLGSVLYAMCTGRPPFRAETCYGILRRITDGEARPIREVNSEIPEWLEAIVGRLHSKSPADRFQTPEEIVDLLERCLAHVRQPTAAPLPVIAPLRSVRSPASGGVYVAETGAAGSPWRKGRVALAIAGIGVLSAVMAALRPFEKRTNTDATPQAGSSKSVPSQEVLAERWDDRLDRDLASIGSVLERLNEELRVEPAERNSPVNDSSETGSPEP